MKFARMIMEAEAPNLLGYENVLHNLAESSVRDRSLNELGIDLGDMSLPYGHHFGEPKLRELIAKQSAENISPADVIVTAGAAGALFVVSSSLLEREDQTVIAFPNYATNFETPYATGCEVVLLEQTFEDDYRIDINKLKTKITDKTRFISLTVPHNPSGKVLPEEDLKQIIDLVEKKEIFLIFDETYRDLTYDNVLPVAASLSDRVISIGSMSKSWGVPGIRIGWLITRNKDLIETFIAAKEQIGITGSVVDEEIAYQILDQRDVLLPKIREEVKESLDQFKTWIENEPRLEWVEPDAGVAAIVRVKNASDQQMLDFYETLRKKYRICVAPGYWFKLPLNMMRIGFCWSTTEATNQGLSLISECIEECFNGS